MTNIPARLAACQSPSTIGHVEDEYDTRYIVGTWEIAEMLGVTRSRVNQMALQRGFPKPYGKLHAGKIWRRTDIEAWIRKRKPAADSS